nr:MAG TPA: hypothetical protein [Caudoviricetes sp.]
MFINVYKHAKTNSGYSLSFFRLKRLYARFTR